MDKPHTDSQGNPVYCYPKQDIVADYSPVTITKSKNTARSSVK